MAEESRASTRRTVIGAGAAALASVAVSDLFNVSSLFAKTGPTNGVGYFAPLRRDREADPRHARRGAVEGRRLRGRLLPAPRHQQPRARRRRS